MHEQEWNDLTQCVACNAAIAAATDRAFAISNDDYLCFGCATERGGIFDEELERWSVPPETSDLVDEQRPHPQP